MPVIIRLRVAESRPLLRGHEHYWSVIMRRTADGGSFTASEVSGDSDPGVEPDVRDFVRRLERAGKIRRVGDVMQAGRAIAGRFEVVERSRATPSLNRDGSQGMLGRRTQQMWNVMRRETGGFTIKGLADLASTDEVAVSAGHAQYYTKALHRAGILLAVGRMPIVYRLGGSANTGPRPPKMLRSHMIYDPNTQQIVGEPEGEEVSP